MVRILNGQHPGRKLGCKFAERADDSACIRIYTNSTCIFCPAAREMLREILKVHEISVELIHEVNCDREEAKDVTALPTIQICGETIVGLPEEDTLDRALWNLRVNPCFYDLRLTQ